MNKLDSVKIDAYIELLSEGISDTNPIDRLAVEKKVDTLYSAKGRSGNIKIIWCESPWQLMVVPVLLEVILELGFKSRSFRKLSANIADPLLLKSLSALVEQIGNDRFDELETRRTGSLKALTSRIKYNRWRDNDWPTLGHVLEAPISMNLPPFIPAGWVNETGAPFTADLLDGPITRLAEPFRLPSYTIKSLVLASLNSSVEPNVVIMPVRRLWFSRHRRFGTNEQSEGARISKPIHTQLNQACGRALFDFLSGAASRRRAAANFNRLLKYSLDSILTTLNGDSFLLGLQHLTSERTEKSAHALSQVDLFTSVFAYSAFDNFCFVCDKQRKEAFDERGTLHCARGPALEFPDGYKLFSWHGTIVPPDVIEKPEHISVGRIDLETNAEVRRVMVERFGIQRYIEDAGAHLLHTDYYGNLYVKYFLNDEPLMMLEVINSTPEPDGTLKRYFLRVPPDVTTAHGAVAWTFGMTAEEYFPIVET